MKNLFKVGVLFVLFFVTISSNAYSYTVAKMTTSFNTAINNIIKNSNNLQEVTINGYKGYNIFYNSETDSYFSKLNQLIGSTSLNNFNYIALTTKDDYKYLIEKGVQPFQCVGFVQAASTIPDTIKNGGGTWNKGKNISKTYFPPRGTVIATFLNGKYDGYYDHTAIFLAGDSNKICVIDQSGSRGYIRIHMITFNTTTGTGNASNYNVVEFWLIQKKYIFIV